MKIAMKLLSDTIFGNGESIPGAEDIAVLTDSFGFPYYKGGTFKGVFREELIRFLELSGSSDIEISRKVSDLLGNSGDDENSSNKLVFSDLTISGNVKQIIAGEMGKERSLEITDLFTNVRTFTAIGENGIVSRGSLRMARCVNKGNVFYGEILCNQSEEELVKSVLGMIKYIGSMRNRGFGNVEICEEVQ